MFCRITSLSEAVTVDEGKPAIFNCTVDANPNDADIITWDLPDRESKLNEFDYTDDTTRREHEDIPPRDGPQKENWRRRLISDKINRTTTMLTILKVKRADAGRVVCRASNGVGGETTKSVATTYLKVNRK